MAQAIAKRLAAVRAAFLGGVALWAAGCSPPEARCVPNETRVCMCSSVQRGVQQCAASGASYSECRCDAVSDAAVTDVPSASMPDSESGIDVPTPDVVQSDTRPVEDARVASDVPSAPIDCRTLAPSLPSGWRRGGPTQFGEVPWTAIAGTFWNPFPNSGGLGVIATMDGEYISIEFTTPSDVAEWSMRAPSKTISWHESQVAGEARIVYVGLSACPGDFRVPAIDSVAPANDPTFARGCRSTRRLGTNANVPMSHVNYVISDAPSDETTCRLAPGRRYYLNYIRADLSDGTIGAPMTEARCVNRTLTRCGSDMRVE